MVSRLDRLFILLDTGSNESIRLAAARQLGEVQRIQPGELDYLLNRIKEYSGKPVWETRIAAGHAIKHILEHVPPWPCKSINHKQAQNHELFRELIALEPSVEQILKGFKLDDVIKQCPSLLSDILQADDSESISNTKSKTARTSRDRGRKSSTNVCKRPNKEQLQRQRQLINKELGISMVDSLNIGVKSTDIISNDDLQANYVVDNCDSLSAEKETGQMVVQCTSNYTRVLSILNKSTTDAVSKQTTEKSSENQLASKSNWPLENVVRNYERDLFNPSWEIRHGSAVALREIIRIHGKYAGRRQEFPDDINDHLNQLWLVDVALKSLCVLALDRFGDFLFDQVVAPVRENAAQLLGCCMANLTKSNTDLIIEILLGMLDNPCWEIRHGGILGLKYSLNALDQLHVREIIHYIFGAIFKCLADNSDDVSAEAAASLVPVKELLLETIPEEAPKLIKFLWEHLVDLDELTASTSNIILLLASLITTRSTRIDTKELVEHIPRLWPLMSHSSTSVRISVLKALTTLTEIQESPCSIWMPCETISQTLRLIFQRSILENVSEIQPYLEAIWLQLVRSNRPRDHATENTNLLQATSQFLNYWLCLTMQPSSTPIDRGNNLWLNIRPDGTVSDTKPDGDVYIGSSTFNAETFEQQRIDITSCRVLGTKLLGALYTNLIVSNEESQYSKETFKYLSDMFVHYLSTKSAYQRMVSGWTIESWADYQSHLEDQDRVSLPENLSSQLMSAIQETSLCYDELAAAFTRIQQEARDLVASLDAASIKTNLPNASDRRMIYNLNQIQYICDLDIKNELERAGSKKPTSSANSSHDVINTSVYTTLVTKRMTLAKSYQTTMATQKSLAISTLSSLSRALISWSIFPAKLRFVVDPLLDSIEADCEMSMQQKSVECLVKLLDFLCRNQEDHNSTIQLIIGRLTDSLFVSSSQSISFEDRNSIPLSKSEDKIRLDCHKILMLDSLQRKAEQSRNLSRRQSSVGTGSSLKRSLSQSSTNEVETNEPTPDTPSRQKANDMKQQGVVMAFKSIVSHYGEELPTKLPILWRTISTDLKSQVKSYSSSSDQSARDQDVKLIKDLTVLQAVGQELNASLRNNLFELFTDLIPVLKSPSPLVRHQICHCVGMISKVKFAAVEDLIQEKIIPLLDSNEVVARCGAIEAIAFIIEYLDLDLIPKIDTFIVNVLRRMSDQYDQVRVMATHCFGKLLSLMPLNHDRDKQSADNDSVKSSVKSAESEFVEQLLDPKKLKNFAMPFKTSVLLRSYQQEGLNWLAFLNRFNLHGILCDEMGLGKTFMAICIVAADHFNQLQSPSAVDSSKNSPSLIVCPPTLVEHWLYEVEKFVPKETVSVLNPVAYGGNVSDRLSIKNSLTTKTTSSNPSKITANLIVTSYDVLRNDIEFFKSIKWNYCVLDEGHIIKNGKTKLFKAIKQISAGHRLILSGTPIQNNVTELWSLFDFLMPGFLGPEKHFNSRYTKPILQSRDHKCSSRDMEAGALAMESLHRQVLPFILRRLKDDVLDDLPPKIIQDYHCELSPLQSKLYEDFTQGKLCNEVTKRSINRLTSDSTDVDVRNLSKNHVFQALQYLKGVCNHPKLVLTHHHSQYNTIKKYLENEKSSLDDINHSSKLRALKQLLIDCGIGLSDESQQAQITQPQAASVEMEFIVNQHRALIFCQLRSMVNIIENDLLKKHLPNITYLKLDGSIQTSQRQAIVSRFNNDPSIDVLLLTTQIGGLGLNLTGADTVIFVEHDWNPTRDLQAMDRAHRIGQKKVVNVYRLITKDTLEEKIMGLQKFKTMVSSAVINQDNTGLGSMNVEQLFDLFDTDSSKEVSKGRAGDKRSAMDLLPDLWDERQYEAEYNLDSFVSTLKS